MVTASQVNRAGKVLRAWWSDPKAASLGPQEARAFEVLTDFRAEHSVPLTKANNGLRSMLRTEGCDVEVSQRLKRTSTIIDKLVRQPAMALSRMQDIGGCRAILVDVDEVRRVAKRVARNRPPARTYDYISEPPPSGYRALHLVVTYDGRSIEIQLRTQSMHAWAVAVERFSGRTGDDLKSGLGPRAVLEWLSAISEARAVEDGGGVVDAKLVNRIGRLREAAAPLLERGP